MNQNISMRLLRFSPRTVPFALLAVTLLSYGIYIPWFGFYGDDWLYIYNYQLFGAASFGAFVAADRPFSGWIYTLTTPLFGGSAWPYHILLLVLRWLCAVLFWWLLRIIWPEHTQKLTWVALLFAVFPGFSQQPIAVQYILHFSIYDLFLVSLATMLLAVQDSRRLLLWMAISLVTSLSLFSMEYFVGLELLRPVLLWMVLRRQAEPKNSQVRWALLYWAPYVFITAIFAVWRVFIFKFPTYQPTLLNGIKADPRDTLLELGRQIALNLKDVLYGSWRQTLSVPAGSVISTLAYIIILLVLLGLLIGYLSRLQRGPFELPLATARWYEEWWFSAVLLGGYALIIAGWPFWFAGVPLDTAFPWDRTMLPFMPGACLVLVGLVEFLVQPRLQVVLLSVLVVLAIGYHYQNAQIYRAEWQNLRSYFWQMAWRAPQLQPGTIVVSDAIPLFRFSDNDLMPLLNWTFAPGQQGPQLPYMYFDLSQRMGADVPEAKAGLEIIHSYRSFRFKGNTNSVLVIYNHDQSCLRFLSMAEKNYPGLPDTLSSMIPLSNLKLVQSQVGSAARPPAALWAEPAHTWCYYFEKADLARQLGDWKQVTALGDEVSEQGYQAGAPAELLVFTEGYARTGNWDRAKALTQTAGQEKALKPLICSTWNRIGSINNLTDEDLAQVDQVYKEFACGD